MRRERQPDSLAVPGQGSAETPPVGAGAGLSPETKGAFLPELEFEVVPPTLQQQEEMADALRILVTWLLKRHRRRQHGESEAA